MNYQEMMVTPEMAKEWLGRNSVNRRINKYRANQYAYDMRTGKWQLNGEAVKIYEDGSLADGQHRLTAIVTVGKPIKMCVITGVPKTVSVQDRGRARSTVDTMLLEGFSKNIANKDTVALAKAHYFVVKYDKNISDGMVKDFLLRNQEMILTIMAVAGGNSARSEGRISLSAPIKLAMFYALNANACNASDLKTFADVLKTGIPTNLNQSAAIVCRNDILSKAINVHGSGRQRLVAVFQTEKAIFDFLNGYPRKVSYGRWETPIYSCLDVNKEA